MNGRFILKGCGDQYMFNLAGGNNQIILTSERYAAKASALDGIEAVRLNSEIGERYQRRVSIWGQPYFVLRAGNEELLGTSETYASASALDGGIATVKATAPHAAVADRTSP